MISNINSINLPEQNWNRESQTESQRLSNTHSQTDVPTPRVKSSHTDITRRQGIGVRMLAPPTKVLRPQSIDTKPKGMGPPPHLKKIKKSHS